MIFRVTMKDPNAIAEGPPVDGHTYALNVAPDFVREWFEYDEYALIEIDTEAGTAVLVKP